MDDLPCDGDQPESRFPDSGPDDQRRLEEASDSIARILTRSRKAPLPAQREANRATLEENFRLRGLLEGYMAALGRRAMVAVTDPQGKIIFVNSHFRRVSGYDESELLGQSLAIINSGHHPREFFAQMWQTITKGAVWHGEICNRSKQGAIHWVDTTIAPLKDISGRIEAYISVRYDVTRLKTAETAVRYHAEHDLLTGLLNRSMLERHFDDAVASTLRMGNMGALVVLNIDGFKQINDAHGHPAGDELLKEFSRRLKQSLRRADVVVRLGGDEFAVILPQMTDKSDVAKVVTKIKAALEKPFVTQRHTIKPQSSFGVALFPRDGQKLPALMRKADFALNRAKTEDPGDWMLFSRAMQTQFERRRKLTEALAISVSSENIEVALQPQFTLADGSHAGFETLARWTRDGKPIPPAEFIPLAEESGLILAIGKQVLERSFHTLRNLKQRGHTPGTLAVNIAAEQISAPDFPHMLEAMVRAHQLSPAEIEIELTENILLDHSGDQIARSLHILRAMGFSVALDDFGTGYASLSHLSRFPVDRIKIDRSFVSAICGGQDTGTIVRSTIELAHALGMQVVAEGIETPEQLQLLRQAECDFGQGYLVSPPLHPDLLAEYLLNAASRVQALIKPALS